MFDLSNLTIAHCDDGCALGSRFPRAASLQIAGIDDVRIGVQHRAAVDMAQRPIVIAMIDELLDRARRIGRVIALAALAGGMQHADIEVARNRGRIISGDILGHVTLREAATMHRHLQRFDGNRLSAFAVEDMDIGRHGELGSEAIFGIMIAEDHEHLDSGLLEAPHLVDEEESGLKIAQVAVKDVACEYNEAAAFVDRKRNEVLERVARGAVDARGVIGRLGGQTEERAVEMEVGRV